MSLKHQRIRTKVSMVSGEQRLKLGGWLSGRNTYLWFGDRTDSCLGVLGDRRLYRLAKAIVRHFEEDTREA